MARIFFTSIFLLFFYINSVSQTTHTINISGLTFSPDKITIAVGDTVFFNGSSDHPVLEVSEDTWNAEDDTPLSGGFSFSSGVGKVAFDAAGTHYYICENHVSSGMKGKIIVSETTSIESSGKQKFQIYPNPLNIDYLTILIPEANNTNYSKLNIYDLTGRNRINKGLPGGEKQIKVDCNNLLPGAYIVQIQKNNTTYTSKFIKK